MAFAIFNKAISGARREPGAYVDMTWVDGASVAYTLQGSIQPAAAKDTSRLLERMPEGARIQSAFKVYTKTAVQLGDILILNGEPHEIMMVDVWQNGILPHFCATGVKMQAEGTL